MPRPRRCWRACRESPHGPPAAPDQLPAGISARLGQ
jgi:hypothetical protein